MSKASSPPGKDAFLGTNCSGFCVVCKSADTRALTTTMLASGQNVIVCGSHELVHRRGGIVASSVQELRAICGERRERKERRDGSADELGARLIAAFSGERREKTERRA